MKFRPWRKNSPTPLTGGISKPCSTCFQTTSRCLIPLPIGSTAGLFLPKFLNEAFEGIASTSFGFRQPSCRVYNDTVGIVNAYDMFRGATKDGKPIAADGRTTLIFVKQGTQWKIVSAHFSHIPHTP